jgi:Fic-DOC domain mobile mystery protein B
MVIRFNDLPLGATPLDDISGLKLNHITTLKELYEAEFQNITQNTGVLLLKPLNLEKLISNQFLFNLHKKMFGDVWEWAGKKRKSNKSVGVDKTLIELEFKKLLDNFFFWKNNNSMDDTEISARLHHKLVQIHPFENGNGRWARLVTNLYLIKSDKSYIKWPEEELFINGTFRDKYINALKSADLGSYVEMIKMHTNIKKYIEG